MVLQLDSGWSAFRLLNYCKESPERWSERRCLAAFITIFSDAEKMIRAAQKRCLCEAWTRSLSQINYSSPKSAQVHEVLLIVCRTSRALLIVFGERAAVVGWGGVWVGGWGGGKSVWLGIDSVWDWVRGGRSELWRDPPPQPPPK